MLQILVDVAERVEHIDDIVVCKGGFLQPLDDLHLIDVGDVVRHDGDGVGPPPHQRLRDPVGDVIEFLRRLQHSLFHLRRDALGSVEHIGYRRPGYPRRFCHVVSLYFQLCNRSFCDAIRLSQFSTNFK